MSESRHLLSSSANAHDYQTLSTSVLSSSPTSFHTTRDTFTRTDTNQSQPYSLPKDGTESISRSCADVMHAKNKPDDQTEEARRRQLLSKEQTSLWLDAMHAKWNRLSASLYLENTGSVARDHLANERTYLAWVRTSLSTISVGVGITQLFRLDRTIDDDPTLRTWGKPIGLLFIFMAMTFLVFAFVRYIHSQTSMTKGYFPASRGIVLFTTLSTFASFVVLLIAVLSKR